MYVCLHKHITDSPLFYFFTKFSDFSGWDPNEITLTIFLPRIIMLLAGGLLGIGMVSGLFGLLSRKHAFFVGERVLDVFAGKIN